jgi:hypothetical protein
MNPARVLRLYSPHSIQLKMHQSRARFIVAACGRQMGKSTGALNHALKFIWEHPGSTVWFISPTFEQAKVQYRRLVGMLWPCQEVMLKKNQTELRVKLINQSQIVFKSGDNFEALRGETLDGCVIDEVREQDPRLWSMVIRPMLAVRRGWCMFISTPNGYDAFYDLAETAKKDVLLAPTEAREPLWEFIAAPSTANPLFTQEEFDSAKRDMSDAQFAQEILAEFRDLTAGKAYINFTEANLNQKNPFAAPGELLNPWLPVILAPDFNLSPMAWGLGQERAGDWYWFNEIWLEGSHTQEASQELVQRLLEWKKMGYMRSTPQVIICGDATAKAGQRAAAGQSDYDVLLAALKAADISFENRTPESNPLVKDRVNSVNAKLKAADGSVHMWINSLECPRMVRDFQRVMWKPNSGILDQKTDPLLTHSSDGPGYAIAELTPIPSIMDVGELKIIRR